MPTRVVGNPKRRAQAPQEICNEVDCSFRVEPAYVLWGHREDGVRLGTVKCGTPTGSRWACSLAATRRAARWTAGTRLSRGTGGLFGGLADRPRAALFVSPRPSRSSRRCRFCGCPFRHGNRSRCQKSPAPGDPPPARIIRGGSGRTPRSGSQRRDPAVVCVDLPLPHSARPVRRAYYDRG